MDHDFVIKKFRMEPIPTNVLRIQGPEPEETAHSLVAVILKRAKTSHVSSGIGKMVRDYLKGPGDGSSEIEAVALASNALKEGRSFLKFVAFLGEGGYGTVLSVEGPKGPAAVKMELLPGYPDFTESPLWREFNILEQTPKQLLECVPRLIGMFGSHASAFVRIWSGRHTVSLLSMELLESSLIYKKESLLEGRIIPDEFRHRALRQCRILDNARAAGISHGDVKNAHFMCRPHNKSLVLVDWGLAETSGFEYTRISFQANGKRGNPHVGKLLYAPALPPSRRGASASKPSLLRLGSSRPNTTGYRPESIVSSLDERHQADVWALAVGWLKGVVLFPNSRGSAEEFENNLYKAARSSVDDFIQFVAKTTGPISTGMNDGVIHTSVNTWLRLVHRVLQGRESFLTNLLNSEPALTEPFYVPSTLDKLRTTGIIVPGVKRQGAGAMEVKEVKPILIMHLEGVGLILLCLLFYLPDERIAYYGGKRVAQGSEEELMYPFNNLPIGQGEQLLGAVSNFFSLEDFIQEPAVGSFFKSSNLNPTVVSAATLREPERLSKVHDSKQSGMTTVPMETRVVHGPGTEPTWPYPWNAGSLTSVNDVAKTDDFQAATKQPFPSHVWKAVANARAAVLSEGDFKDAAVSENVRITLRPEGMPAEIYDTMCS
jgi:serine/threonine protein kinase